MKCECCNDAIVEGRYCKFCEKLYFKDFPIDYVPIKKEKVIPEKLEARTCPNCKVEFMPKNKRHKFCNHTCRPYFPLPPNERWLNKK